MRGSHNNRYDWKQVSICHHNRGQTHSETSQTRLHSLGKMLDNAIQEAGNKEDQVERDWSWDAEHELGGSGLTALEANLVAHVCQIILGFKLRWNVCFLVKIHLIQALAAHTTPSQTAVTPFSPLLKLWSWRYPMTCKQHKCPQVYLAVPRNLEWHLWVCPS